MKQRDFGKTGLKVSEMIFGGGNVGGLLIRQDDDTKRKAIRTALDAGINWIDTAASYGPEISEESLGWLLNEIDDTPFVSTKFRIHLDSPDDFATQIENSLMGSLKRLRRDSVDLLQLHNHIAPEAGGRAITVDHVLGPNGVADGLDRLRDKGLIKFAGITALNDAESVRAVIESGRIDSAQIYYNILNPSAGQAMPDGWKGHDLGNIIASCKANGVAVMAIRVLAAGVLATTERHGREGMITKDTDLANEERSAKAILDALGSEYGTPAQTALRFAISHPDLSGAIVGMAELSHLDEALAAVALGPLPQEALDRIQAVYAANFGAS
jgi:L-galactose dehydrogenase/L-glyceraldehyde 3-phosphate reductase